MKLIKILEHITIKDISFDIELEYYYDEELCLPCVDEELGNKNLKKIKEKYESILKEKNQL